MAKEAVVSVQYEYRAAEGSPYTDEDAQVIGETLMDISERYGSISRERLLEVSTPPESRTHRYFEWNDQRAAHKWRLKQAGDLIRCVSVVIMDDKGEEKAKVRAFVKPVYEKEVPYQPVVEAFRSPDFRQQMLHRAMLDLQAFYQKYRAFDELSGVFKAIEEVKENLSDEDPNV